MKNVYLIDLKNKILHWRMEFIKRPKPVASSQPSSNVQDAAAAQSASSQASRNVQAAAAAQANPSGDKPINLIFFGETGVGKSSLINST